VAAGVAATERPGTRAAAACGSLVAAALALPGAASAQLAPAPAQVSFKWLDYEDWQPGLERIRVRSPLLFLALPLGEQWGLETSYAADSVSGATPRWHTSISSASVMHEHRRGGDIKVTRYLGRQAWSAGFVASNENDFVSRAVSLQGIWANDDNTQTWDAALAYTRDRIGSVNDPTLDEHRRTVAVSGNLTQALTPADIVQLGLSYASGRGYYSDPYKEIDIRPGERRQWTAMVRWNHYFESTNTALRTAWRGYRDSFGIRSQTVELEAAYAAKPWLTIVPGLRLYTQSAASFYYDPIYSYIGPPYPVGWLESPPRYLSPDQRLAAFGAVGVSLKFAFALGDDWVADVRVERYEQRTSWRLGGPGSPGLEPLYARFLQFGITHYF
jgi:hypothetical protein